MTAGETLLRAALLGAAAGMRSMTPPALLTRRLAGRPPNPDAGRAEGLLAAPLAAPVATAAMMGEIIADKLPGIPSRLDAGPLLGRVAVGVLCGTILATEREERVGAGIAGGIGALAGAFALYHLRRALTRDTGLPDLPVALAEDLLCLASARWALGGRD